MKNLRPLLTFTSLLLQKAKNMWNPRLYFVRWKTGWHRPYQQWRRSLYSLTTQILKACYHSAFSCNSGMLKRRVLALVDEKQVVYKRVNTSLINNEGAAAIVLSYYPDCKACYHSACSCETLGCKPHDSRFGRWQSGRLRGVDTYLINNEEAAAIVLSYYLNWKKCCHSAFSYKTLRHGTSFECEVVI